MGEDNQVFHSPRQSTARPAFPSMSMNEHQKRGFAVALRLLEITLDDIEALLRGDREGTLYSIRTRMSAKRNAELMALSAEVRVLLAELAQKYDLDREERDGKRIISGLLSARWEAFEDTRPQKMRRYGPVDPKLVPELGPSVERLIELVLAMERLTR